MDIDEAVDRACKEPTIVDALSWICVWESERVVKQVRENFGSGANGADWDTCFRVCLQKVIKKYEIRFGINQPELKDLIAALKVFELFGDYEGDAKCNKAK